MIMLTISYSASFLLSLPASPVPPQDSGRVSLVLLIGMRAAGSIQGGPGRMQTAPSSQTLSRSPREEDARTRLKRDRQKVVLIQETTATATFMLRDREKRAFRYTHTVTNQENTHTNAEAHEKPSPLRKHTHAPLLSQQQMAESLHSDNKGNWLEIWSYYLYSWWSSQGRTQQLAWTNLFILI